jgi:hypothetical protein
MHRSFNVNLTTLKDLGTLSHIMLKLQCLLLQALIN